ncbi:hypothetical protein A9G28_03015 [Gilliamella sp. Fer1-1]|nr:hypothetical protein A9G47_04120 [Gilliamella apicola]OCG40620.1 hypothetical protein A9G29_01045 [Gilliamella apicola]OCG44073.1 hypothetical protein A9G28_03015 [Gilliamella apicola]OCG58114.1 hypothetical protein A9G40_11115 [Gilliamella apicola]
MANIIYGRKIIFPFNLFPYQGKSGKIYDTRQKSYSSKGQTVIFKCIVSFKYDDNPASIIFSSYNDEQKLLENCILL